MYCSSGKQSYFTRSRAKDVCKLVKSTGKGNRHTNCMTKLMPYICTECGMWHLTSIKKLVEKVV